MRRQPQPYVHDRREAAHLHTTRNNLEIDLTAVAQTSPRQRVVVHLQDQRTRGTDPDPRVLGVEGRPPSRSPGRHRRRWYPGGAEASVPRPRLLRVERLDLLGRLVAGRMINDHMMHQPSLAGMHVKPRHE